FDVVERPIIRVASDDKDWSRVCDGWSKKAKSDAWFSESEKKDFDKASEDSKVQSVDTCKTFFIVQNRCETFLADYYSKEVSANTFMKRIESTQGCKAIVGFTNVCDALKEIANKGIKLSDDRNALMVECLTGRIKDGTRVGLIRPM